MKFVLAIFAVIFVLSLPKAEAQVVINSDGSLPAPSVSPMDYPKLVQCTLNKRRGDVEALLATKRKRSLANLEKLKDGQPRDWDSELMVATVSGEMVAENRLIIQIVQSCQKLKEGYPLGFWPDQLYKDWSEELSFGLHAQRLDSDQFAECLTKNRRELVVRYLDLNKEAPEAKKLFSQMFEQGVCTPKYPAIIKEKRVRKNLLKLRSLSDA